jgi:hypothetical protein
MRLISASAIPSESLEKLLVIKAAQYGDDIRCNFNDSDSYIMNVIAATIDGCPCISEYIPLEYIPSFILKLIDWDLTGLQDHWDRAFSLGSTLAEIIGVELI